MLLVCLHQQPKFMPLSTQKQKAITPLITAEIKGFFPKHVIHLRTKNYFIVRMYFTKQIRLPVEIRRQNCSTT